LFTTDNTGAVVSVQRPSFTGAPTNIGYQQQFTVNTQDAAKIQSVVLMRPGSSTHAFDMEQRLVGLNFTAGAGTLNITAPPNSNIAPPGYYMLFILGSTDPKDPLKKVPSMAAFVRLSFNPSNLPPKGTIAPSGPITVQAQTPVTFTGSGTDTSPGTVARYSWVFPQGDAPGTRPVTSNQQNPLPVSFPAPGTYVASLTTVDNQDESDPSPPTCTIMVTAAQVQLTVNITQPAAANSTVRGKNVNVAATVNGATGTSNTFTLKITSASGAQVFSQTQTTSGSSARFKWDTTRSPNGAYTITVSVQDSTRRTATSSPKTATVQN
jgi:Domain of unknown function (DUF1929)/PKD domain